MRTFMVVLSAAGFFAGPAVHAADDSATLKKLLSTVSAWDAKGKTKFDEATQKQLADLAGQIDDAKLREQTKSFLPELERAVLLQARVNRVIADVKEVGGTTKTEPGGPAWLRERVGDEPMALFTRLVGVDLQDRNIPIKSGIKNERITDEWLERIADLPDLRNLDISITVVKGPGLKHVGTCKNLETLNITLTLITDDQVGQLRGLGKLRIISFASTKCTGEGLKGLKLPQLENLNFHYTPVNDEGLKHIGDLTSLERLEIVHTHFTDEGAKHLDKLTNMKRIQIGSREATGAAVAPLRAMKQLRELDLHDGQATTEGVKYASEIPSLTVLRVYGPVKDEGMQHIGKLVNLEMLIVQSAQITDAGLAPIAGLKKLKRLEIQGNKITDAGVAKLKESLPDLEVVR